MTRHFNKDTFSKFGRSDLIELLLQYLSNDNTLKIFKTHDHVKTPERFGLNAGFDFFIPRNFCDEKSPFVLKSGDRISIASGIKVKIPHGHALIAFNKSGIATKYGIQVGAQVVDENYTGEIHLSIINTSNDDFLIKPNMKIIQFVLVRVNYATPIVCNSIDELYSKEDYKERGEEGFGSTGI